MVTVTNQPAKLYINTDGSGQFQERSTDWNVNPDGNVPAVLAADVNADGFEDLYFSAHAFDVLHPDILLINTGSESFVDVSDAVGVTAATQQTSLGGAAFDAVHSGRAGVYATPTDQHRMWDVQLDGSVLDMAPAWFPAPAGYTLAVAAADFDGDGDCE